MAADYIDVTRGTLGEPDDSALVPALRAALADATVGFFRAPGSMTYRLKKNSPWTVALAQLAKTTIDAAPISTPQTIAQGDVDRFSIALRALVLTLLDEINILRGALGLPLRTQKQALDAIRAKAGQLP